MSKPKDPVLAVIAYFETADLALARQTLAIVQQTLKRRLPAAAKAKAQPAKKKPVRSIDEENALNQLTTPIS